MKLTIEKNDMKIEIEADSLEDFDYVLSSIRDAADSLKEKEIDISEVLADTNISQRITSTPGLSTIDAYVPNYCTVCGSLIEDCLCPSMSTDQTVCSTSSTAQIENILQSSVLQPNAIQSTLATPEIAINNSMLPNNTINLDINAVLSQEVSVESVLGEPNIAHRDPQILNNGFTTLENPQVTTIRTPDVYEL